MGILKCCKNCSLEHLPHNDNCMWCKFWHEDNKKGKDLFTPKEELVRQDYKSQLIHDFREYIETVIKYYNSTCGEPDEYDYGVRKGFEMAIKYIIKYDYKEE